jgi:hypothetical protein
MLQAVNGVLQERVLQICMYFLLIYIKIKEHTLSLSLSLKDRIRIYRSRN